MNIAINSVISAECDELSGLHRIVAICPEANVAFLYPLGKRLPKKNRNDPIFVSVSLETLSALLAAGQARTVEVKPDPRYLKTKDDLSDGDRLIYDRREQVMQPLLDHAQVSSCLLTHGRRIGPLIRTAIADTFDRSIAYELIHRLGTHGWASGSLNPEFDKCGGRDVPRPVGAAWVDAKGRLRPPREKAGRKAVRQVLEPTSPVQQGVSEVQRIAILAAWKTIPRPKPKGKELYDRITEKAFATTFVTGKNGELIPQLPPEGTYPNRSQTERVIRVYISAPNRAAGRVAKKFFERNLRGLVGKAYNGVAGPGHCYAIDSTVGDIFLRSSIDRAWYVGRPVLYRIVDVWSGVTVAFYLCLSGPSWAQAKVAVFCCCAPAPILDELRGFSSALALSPAPMAPYQLLCDRGEYLSHAASETQMVMRINDMSYLPSYRPDLGGLKEIGFRLIKDGQYGLVYGAIDARRKEFELSRHRYKDSAWTLFEYAEYLNFTFGLQNEGEIPKARKTADVVAAGCNSRAELWSFGFAAGVGYAKEIETARCITSLLPRDEATVTHAGIKFRGQTFAPPEREMHEKLTGLARLKGDYKVPVHAYPTNMQCAYWADSRLGLTKLDATLDAPVRQAAPVSYDEWIDALMYRRRDEPTREHTAQQRRLEHRAWVKAHDKRARQATAEAEARAEGKPRPTVSEARAMESEGFVDISSHARANADAPTEDRLYAQRLKKLLSELDR